MPVVPVLPAVTTGIYTTSQVSAIVAALFFDQNKPRAQLRATAPQAIATGGTGTAVQFTTEDIDTDPQGIGGHDNVTNNTRWTAQYPGRYWLAGGVTFAANTVGRRGTWWAVNGVAFNASETMIPATAANPCSVAARGMEIFLNIGDFVELIAYQESGAPLNTSGTTFEQPSMSVVWLALS